MGSKAVAGTSTTALAGAFVAVVLWALHITPPQEIVLAMQALVAAPLTYLAVYFTPHDGSAPPVTPPVFHPATRIPAP